MLVIHVSGNGGFNLSFLGVKNTKPLYPSRTERFKLSMISDKSFITQISNKRKAWDFSGKNNIKRRAITALPIQNPVAESSFITESNLIETPLPALYKRGIAKCFPLYLFSVIHHLNIMKRIAI